MAGDLERLPAAAAGPAAVAAEVLGRVRAEIPVIGGLGERDQVLVAAWLTGLRSARTRRAYAGDAVAWLGWLDSRNADVLISRRLSGWPGCMPRRAWRMIGPRTGRPALMCCAPICACLTSPG